MGSKRYLPTFLVVEGGDEGEGGGSLKYNVHMVGFVRMLLQVHGSLLVQN